MLISVSDFARVHDVTARYIYAEIEVGRLPMVHDSYGMAWIDELAPGTIAWLKNPRRGVMSRIRRGMAARRRDGGVK